MDLSFVPALFRRSILSATLALTATTGFGQTPSVGPSTGQRQSAYVDSTTGLSSADLIKRAFATNTDLAAARVGVTRARGRLVQSRLRPNPSIEVEKITGNFTGSLEHGASIELGVPIELAGKRGKRVDVAELELSAAEAEVLDRERRLALEIRTSYAEALAAVREVETSEEIRGIDARAARILEDRVAVGDAPPLDLNLMRVEIERLASRITVARGRLMAALLRLKALIGASPSDALLLQPELDASLPLAPPTDIAMAVSATLKDRPDIRLARLNEEIASAGLRLARAEAVPNMTAYTRFSVYTSDFDETPVGLLLDHDRLLSFGMSITLPFANRNQGAILEASASILQARKRREFLEQLARSEVNSAYERYLASNTAATTFEQGVIAGTRSNLQAIQGAYEIGEFRITDLLTEQRRLIDSQREFTDLLSERYRALTDLQAAMGAPVN